MLKIISIFTLVLLYATITFGQAAIEIPFDVADDVGNSKTLIFGLDLTATGGIDPALGEVEQPPLPPTGVFDTRFVSNAQSTLGQGTLVDIRNAPAFPFSGSYIHQIYYQTGDLGTTVTISWDLPPEIITGSEIRDLFGGVFYAAPFVGTGSMIITNPALVTGLEIEVVYDNIEPSAPAPFFDDFEAYTAGVQLVAQNNVDWDTWSGGGGTGEDPFVSDSFAYSGSNSVVIAQNNDLIRHHGGITTGKWYISLLVYIPTGKAGYFNTMSGFTPNPFQWAMEVYFDVGGGGRLEGVPGAPIAFTWVEDTWQQAIVVVDLDTDSAEFWFGGSNPLTMVSTWQWTQGGTVNLQLDANDFFGATANDEMYMDDYYFSDIPPGIIPVELISFTASVNQNDVTLNWVTASEINNQGFEIERNSGDGFQNIGFVPGFGTSTETQSYSFIDNTLNEGSYSYRLKQIDFNGTFEYSDVVEVDVTVPDVFTLEQNYPNPFNPTTRIDFSLAVDSKVSLKVFDVLGQEVATLINSNLVAGSHNIDFNASSLNSGVYIYKLQAGSYVETKKMVLMK